MTAEGQLLEQEIHHHAPPSYQASLYESFNLSANRWGLQVFTPFREENGKLAGYFEGTRLVPAWQKKQILVDSLMVALMVGLASLLCGGVLFPVVIRLSSENQHKVQELLESHISMMKALGRTIAKRDSITGTHNYCVTWNTLCSIRRLHPGPSHQHTKPITYYAVIGCRENGKISLR